MTRPTPMDRHDEPTLAEDLLLVLFQPRSGTIAGENTLFYVLGGAVLAELALGGLVRVGTSGRGRGRLETMGAQPPADPVLRSGWEYVDEKPRGMQAVLAAVGPQLRGPVLDRLIDRGDIERVERKLIFLRTHALTEGSTGRRAQLLREIRAVLVDGADPTPRVAALASLLSGSGSLQSLDPEIPWSSEVIVRGKELEAGHWGAAAAEAVAGTVTATVVTTVLGASAARSSLRDGLRRQRHARPASLAPPRASTAAPRDGDGDDMPLTDLLTNPHPRVLGAVAALACLAVAGAIVVPAATSTPTSSSTSSTTPTPSAGASETAPVAAVRAELAAIERRRDARVGVLAIDTATGDRFGYRADERFALASTVKVLLAGVVLDRLSDRELEQRLFWSEAGLAPYSPLTELFVEDGMTVRQLIDAALTISDNTATNVLFDLVGGPGAVDDRLAELGDSITSIDRVEPDLNDWRPGELRDTSTPRALADVVHDLTLGDLLSRSDRWVLNDDLGDSLTGARLVRAGVPASWRVGDKSGTASYGTRNNVAVVHPPGREPWIVVVLTSHDDPAAETDDALVAQATRVVVDHWA